MIFVPVCCSSSSKAQKPQLCDLRHNNCQLRLGLETTSLLSRLSDTDSPHRVHAHADTKNAGKCIFFSCPNFFLSLSLLNMQELRPGPRHLSAFLLHVPRRPAFGRVQGQGRGEEPSGRGGRESQLQHLWQRLLRHVHRIWGYHTTNRKAAFNRSVMSLLVFPMVQLDTVSPGVTNATVSWIVEGNLTRLNVLCQVHTAPHGTADVSDIQMMKHV